MAEIHSILAKHPTRERIEESDKNVSRPRNSGPAHSLIPDLFFDDILVRFKLGRIEIAVLMYLYRSVWCYPNLYQKYGISAMLSHSDMAKFFDISIQDLHNSLKQLEALGLIETIRSGQYFVRRYFIREFDEMYGQIYDDI